jgi:archaellin
MLTRNISVGYSAAGVSINATFALEAGAEVTISETIPASSTNLALSSFALDVSQVKALVMVAAADMVVETNSGSSPVNVFTLTANVPFLWFTGQATLRDTAGTAVSTDITSLFVTSTAGGLLDIRALVDPTA